jgi:hypothetical protein
MRPDFHIFTYFYGCAVVIRVLLITSQFSSTETTLTFPAFRVRPGLGWKKQRLQDLGKVRILYGEFLGIDCPTIRAIIQRFIMTSPIGGVLLFESLAFHEGR